MANPFRNIRIFLGETVAELRKSQWPTGEELKNSTIVVFIAMALLAVYTSLADFSIYSLVTLFTNIVRPLGA